MQLRDSLKEEDILWYKQPAKEWTDALPLGNGRIGAMVYGKALQEIIQVDESTFWSGESSRNNNRAGTKELIDCLRELLLAGKYEEADRLGHNLVGNKNNYGTNMPVANLKIHLLGIADSQVQYEKRSLNIRTGIARTDFDIEGIGYSRETFVSNPGQLFVMRFASNGEKDFHVEIQYDGIGNDVGIIGEENGDFLVAGHARETLHSNGKTGVDLWGRIRILTDGESLYERERICLWGATQYLLLFALHTDMFEAYPDVLCKKQLDDAVKRGKAAAGMASGEYEATAECEAVHHHLYQEHIRDCSGLYNRMSFTLGKREGSEAATDERIRFVADGGKDPALMALMFQYGRYLLIASSREDSPLPTHMGGIWNDNIYNNIDCTQDMHIDMNIQMQYWLSAVCSLPECYLPLFKWMETTLVPSGKLTAHEAYKAKGWVAHVVSNPWGFTSLGWGYNWGVWAMGGVWSATLLWDYYEYVKDMDFLRTVAYPILKGAVEFVADYMFFEEGKGTFMTGPSYSPENHFIADGKEYCLSLSPTCDIVLVREILDIFIKASLELAVDEGECEDQELVDRLQGMRNMLPGFQIGKKGQIQEWDHDFDELNPGHRHTSHLLGLYPFHQIHPTKDPQLAKAARKSIELRYEEFEITSWGFNMMMGYYARLKDGDAALGILKDIFKSIVKPNMASVMSDGTTMWQGTWELDGNTGITASICEMLVQSTKEYVHILPALPSEWGSGSIKGIRIKGGHFADIEWKDNELTSFCISSEYGQRKKIRYQKREVEYDLIAGRRLCFDGKLNMVEE